MDTTKWLKVAIVIIIAMLFFNIYAYFTSKGSATQHIDNAIDSIKTAITKIDQAKANIQQVYDNLDTTQQQLMDLRTNVGDIHSSYKKESKIIRREIDKSQTKVYYYKEEIKKETDSISTLQKELIKLE